MRHFLVYIECLLSRICSKLGFTYKKEPIPDGVYCYDRDGNACKYFRITKEKAGCTYLGYFGDDLLLTDQCKICGVKDRF